MKFLKYWLPIAVAACGLSAAAYADCECTFDSLQDPLDERDIEMVIEFVNSKRTIDLQEKACNLAISGNIKTDWQHTVEKVAGQKVTGGTSCDGSPIGKNVFNVAFNLMFDYRCDRSWGVTHLEFKNPMGTAENHRKACKPLASGTGTPAKTECNPVDPNYSQGSGQKSGINLRKAYWGYNICTDGASRLDIEVGRRNLFDVFDSRIQFMGRFDGVLLRYASQFDCADFYVTGGAFVVDQRVNHFGGVIETGLLNVMDLGLDLKYSFIHWRKKGQNRCGVSDPLGWRFGNSQFTAIYRLDPEVLCAPASIYGAVLVNHSAKRILNTNSKKNIGWYIGARVGEVCGSGDWAVDLNWQSVQAQAVADTEVSGIGRGNALDSSFTQYSQTNPSIARGNANYQGFKLMGLYGVTDNLSLEASFQYARPESKSIGGSLNFNRFKLEAIYAF